MVITDLGVFTIDKKAGGMTLIELAPDVTLEDIKSRTEASYQVAPGAAIGSGLIRPKSDTEGDEKLRTGRCRL